MADEYDSMPELSEETKAAFRAQDAERQRFFALIGHCVTQYQTVEDYLEEIFAAALDSTEARASAIYAVARGLEQKINLISAALADRDSALLARWVVLRGRVTRAAEDRNSIAHGNPVNHGGVITVVMDDSRNVISTERTEGPRMELHKKLRNQSRVWVSGTLSEVYDRIDRLFRELIAFKHQLRGEPVPETLTEDAAR